MLFRKTSPVPDVHRAQLQDAADAAAWKLLLRQRPEIADRVRLALARGWRPDEVVAAASELARGRPAWARVELLLPCAVHGCALHLRRERQRKASASTRGNRLGMLRAAMRRSA